MQMEALECGAACLAMILAYYGKWVALARVREDCGVSRDGSKAKNILIAARHYDLNAKGYRVEADALLKNGGFPCIVHWEFNHFIVLTGVRGNRVHVNDPARGSIVMSREDFDEGFTGVVLRFTPGQDFVPSGEKRSLFEFSKRTLKGTGPAVVFVMLTSVISTVAGILSMGFTRFFLDHLLTRRDLKLLYPFLAFLTVFAAIQIIASAIDAIYSRRINGKIAIVGTSSYFWHVLRLPMRFFSQRMAGDIQQRQGLNESIASSLVNTIAPLWLQFGMMVFYLVVMLRYSVMLTLVGILTVAVNVLVARLVSAARINVTRVMVRDEGKLAGTTVSGIEMIETLKASGAEIGFFQKWAGYQASVNSQKVRFQMVNAWLSLIPSLIGAFTDVLVLILGVFLVIRGEFTPGMVFVFQGFMSEFLAPADDLISAGQTIMETRTEMERLEDVMAYPAVIPEETIPTDSSAEKEESYQKLKGYISIRNVTFGYARLAEPLIRDFNLELTPGKRVAFVGASGCGKSTLSKLISGLYEPWSGEILFDGKKREDIRRSVFTGSLAVVDQEITLFEDSIDDNIRMWDRSIENYEVILAARDAKIHDVIMEREGGYHYRILENGKDFSGGQRQRMEIARVLAQDPTILILDEATSALDAQTEAEVVRAIRDRGITCIVVAHRLSTVRDCDEILVMDHGQVTERGTHEELMALGGKYKELITAE